MPFDEMFILCIVHKNACNFIKNSENNENLCTKDTFHSVSRETASLSFRKASKNTTTGPF